MNTTSDTEKDRIKAAGNTPARCRLPGGKKPLAVFLSSAALLCVFIFGCRVESFLPGGFGSQKSASGLIFSHQRHIGRGFSCAVCHQFYSEKEPIRPPERVCRFCHEVGDRQNPTPDCATCHAETDFSVAPPPRKTFSDSKFAHDPHLKKEVECRQCHGKLDYADQYNDIAFPQMKQCLACHRDKEVDRDCRTCHERRRKDRKPESHEKLWRQAHGGEAVDRFDTNCTYCHDNKDFCQGCHMARPPGTHTLFFKNRGHGFWAEIDRNSCKPCHQQDFCLSCHGPEGEVMPPFHRGGFLDRPPYLHCARCHFPDGAANGCRACHRADTIQRKHLEANEMKSAPIPDVVLETSLNCLNACHPFDEVRPPHPLGGLISNDCIRCHMPEGGF